LKKFLSGQGCAAKDQFLPEHLVPLQSWRIIVSQNGERKDRAALFLG
jgi:hypothetical protein